TPAPLIEPSPDHTTAAVSFPSLTQPTQPSPETEQHILIPHDSPLYVVHSHRSDEGSLKLIELTNLVTKLSERIGVLEDDLKKTMLTYSTAVTKLILRVKKLKAQVKAGKARKGARVVLSEDDVDVEDDSSKQGRKLSDTEVQEKASTETEPIIQEVTPTEVIQDQGSDEKGNSKVSTAGATKGTASEVPVVSTAEENISTAGRTVTYKRRSVEERTRKDKGKAIMIEPEPKKKSKKELEQERLSFAEAIRLQEQMDEEQRAQIARDEEITRQWNEEEEQRVMSEAKSTNKKDWNDPSVIRYHALKMKPKTVAQARRNMVKYLKNQGNYKISDFKGMSYNEIRPIFEKVWDFNQHIKPMEHGSEKMESPEKIEEEDVDTQKEMKEVSKESGAKRKKSIPRKSTRGTVKRQKKEEETEKEDLKGYLDIVLREEFAEDVESLSTKYPIMDWKTCVLTENFMYYQIFRGDGSYKNYKVLSEMLEDFNRQYGDLHTLFEPDGEDEIWKNQHEYNLISWSLCDFCGIYILLMQNRIAIHMLTEKKYPLSQEMISKMLKKRLEVDHESTQAYELLKFIKSQVQKGGLLRIKHFRVSTAKPTVSTARRKQFVLLKITTARQENNPSSREVSTAVPKVNIPTPEDLVGPIPAFEDTQVEDQEIELGNIPQSYVVPTTPHTRIHKHHPIEHVNSDVQSSVQTRRMKTSYSEQSFLSAIYEGKSYQDLHTCLFACFLSQEEPKRVSKALSDPTWVEAMQEELLQFKLQKVWILVDLPKGHRAIGTKWVYRNKKDERGIVIRNKARQDTTNIHKEEDDSYGLFPDSKMDAQAKRRQECSKTKEESKEECIKSRKTKKIKCLEESSHYYCWFKITVVGEKVNVAESLLVVSTEVNAD
ncbi:hypothetical protein Tco_0393832, partial [Tanacetum coccineum]